MITIKRLFIISIFSFTIAGISLAQPVKPSITQITPQNPEGLDDVVLTASAYTHPSGTAHKATYWQFSIHTGFAVDPANNQFLYREYTFPVDYVLSRNDSRPNAANTGITIPNEVLPFDIPLFARVQYIDENDSPSAFSDPLQFTLKSFSDRNLIYSQDFESVPAGGLPTGWKSQSFTTGTLVEGAGYSADFFNWSVQDLSFLNTIFYYPGYLKRGGENDLPEFYYSGVPIVQGKSMHADSGGFGGGLYDVRLITESYNLTGVTGVVVTFYSDYLQNQDNIAAVEYTVDGGDITGGGSPASPVDLTAANVTGTWNPALYYLDSDDVVFTVEGDPSSGISADFTLFKTADGTDPEFFFEDFLLARKSVAEVEELAPFIQPMMEEDGNLTAFKDNKRFERIRLSGLDNQAAVKFAFMYMGTFSWYWGFDNFQIWGDNGQPSSVDEWSLY